MWCEGIHNGRGSWATIHREHNVWCPLLQGGGRGPKGENPIKMLQSKQVIISVDKKKLAATTGAQTTTTARAAVANLVDYSKTVATNFVEYIAKIVKLVNRSSGFASEPSATAADGEYLVEFALEA